MEGSQSSNYDLRRRSRSNTPYLGLNSDSADDRAQTGRTTPLLRTTPIKQVLATTSKTRSEPVIEEEEATSSPHHVHRTRLVTRNLKSRLSTEGSTGTPEPPEDLRKEVTRNLRNRYSVDGAGTPEPDSRRGKTRTSQSRFSTEDSGIPESFGDQRKEIIQNNINTRYEYDRHYEGTLADVTLSPIGAYRSQSTSYDASAHRSFSPAYSVSSTDSLFVEQALQDVSALVDRDPRNREHLPSRLYVSSGEYWNKYPKTDYTYSTASKDRVELAPGQIAVPNMSRRSLQHFRTFGPNTSLDEVDEIIKDNAWFNSSIRKRLVAAESSDDEDVSYSRQLDEKSSQWWLTSVFTTLLSMVVTSTQNTYRSVFGPKKGYPYTNLPPRKGVLQSSASALAAPFVWIYTKIISTVTTTITTITETITPSQKPQHYTPAFGVVSKQKQRRWWPWLLLLFLPIFGYGSYYTYENFDEIALPNFDNFKLDLPEFSAMPIDINLTLPTFSDRMPDIAKTYSEYKDIVHNRMADASDYVRVVANSCLEEAGRYWRGIVGSF